MFKIPSTHPKQFPNSNHRIPKRPGETLPRPKIGVQDLEPWNLEIVCNLKISEGVEKNQMDKVLSVACTGTSECCTMEVNQMVCFPLA